MGTTVDQDEGMTPFLLACKNGKLDIMDWLESHGMPPSEMTRLSKIHILVHERSSGFWV